MPSDLTVDLAADWELVANPNDSTPNGLNMIETGTPNYSSNGVSLYSVPDAVVGLNYNDLTGDYLGASRTDPWFISPECFLTDIDPVSPTVQSLGAFAQAPVFGNPYEIDLVPNPPAQPGAEVTLQSDSDGSSDVTNNPSLVVVSQNNVFLHGTILQLIRRVRSTPNSMVKRLSVRVSL